MKKTITQILHQHFFKISFAFIFLTLFFYIMRPFILPVVFGGITAMALARFVDFFIKKGFSRKTSLLLVSFLVAFIGFIPVAGFLIRGSRIIENLIKTSNFNEISSNLTAAINVFIVKVCDLYGLDQTFIEGKFNNFIISVGKIISDILSNFLSEIPFMFMMGIVVMLSAYLFLRESDNIRKLFNRYFYFSKKSGDQFIHTLRVCCREVFFSNIITGVIQACIVSIGAIVFQTGDFFLVFFTTFILSFIPVIGAAPVAAALSIICFADSRLGAGTGMLIIAAITSVADNISRSYLGSFGEVSVHPFIGLLAVIGGVIMFGLAGIFIGPLVVSIIFGALPIILNEYFSTTEMDENKG